MVQKTTGDPGKYLNSDWHQTRWEAETETYNIREWGPIDREKYDLDSVAFSTKYKDSVYISDARLDVEGASKRGFDVRDLPTRE